jgi:hypothetical protein
MEKREQMQTETEVRNLRRVAKDLAEGDSMRKVFLNMADTLERKLHDSKGIDRRATKDAPG